jgi:hypothetical protein
MDVSVMTILSRWRGHEIRLCLIAFLLCVAGFLWTQPDAHSLPPNIPYTVKVTATGAQQVNIHAEVGGGANLFSIIAHVCAPDADVSNTYAFGFQGPNCSNQAIGDGDVEAKVVLQNATAGDVPMRLGIGAVTWIDEIGYVHSLACGPDHPCNLVVELQVTNGTIFKSVPFIAGVPADPPAAAPAPTTAPPAPAPSAAPPAATSGAGAGAGGSGGSSPTATTAPCTATAASATTSSTTTTKQAPTSSSSSTTTTRPCKAAGKDGGASGGSSASLSGKSDPAQLETPAPASAVSDASAIAHRAAHVFWAMASGLVGGLMIALIVMRARKHAALNAVSTQ